MDVVARPRQIALRTLVLSGKPVSVKPLDSDGQKTRRLPPQGARLALPPNLPEVTVLDNQVGIPRLARLLEAWANRWLGFARTGATIGNGRVKQGGVRRNQPLPIAGDRAFRGPSQAPRAIDRKEIRVGNEPVMTQSMRRGLSR
jgi:hypothetical protein